MIKIKKTINYVFLDTEVYRSNSFDFQNKNFAKLLEFIADEKIQLIITTVTIGEINNQIKELCDSSITKLKSFKKNNPLLRIGNDAFGQIWKINSADKISSTITSNFDTFLEISKATIIGIENVSSNDIFEKYFSTQPPFQKGKKKEEFPDAFAISSLEQYCEDIHKKVFIVSGDSDWKAACKNNKYFTFFCNLNELYQFIQFSGLNIADIFSIFDLHKEEIKRKIATNFENLSFYLNILNTDKIIEDAKVDGIRVDSINELSTYITNVNDELIQFESKFDIAYLCKISYSDKSDAHFNPETNYTFLGSHILDAVNRTEKVTVEIKISLSKHNEKTDTILAEVRFPQEDIEVLLENEEIV